MLQVLDLTSSLEQSERTHELRDQADQVIKDELCSYERSKKREGLQGVKAKTDYIARPVSFIALASADRCHVKQRTACPVRGAATVITYPSHTRRVVQENGLD